MTVEGLPPRKTGLQVNVPVNRNRLCPGEHEIALNRQGLPVIGNADDCELCRGTGLLVESEPAEGERREDLESIPSGHPAGKFKSWSPTAGR